MLIFLYLWNNSVPILLYGNPGLTTLVLYKSVKSILLLVSSVLLTSQ